MFLLDAKWYWILTIYWDSSLFEIYKDDDYLVVVDDADCIV